jgi:hypothetical protein
MAKRGTLGDFTNFAAGGNLSVLSYTTARELLMTTHKARPRQCLFAMMSLNEERTQLYPVFLAEHASVKGTVFSAIILDEKGDEMDLGGSGATVRCNDQMNFLILDEEQLEGALAVWANLPPFVAGSVSEALGDLTPIRNGGTTYMQPSLSPANTSARDDLAQLVASLKKRDDETADYRKREETRLQAEREEAQCEKKLATLDKEVVARAKRYDKFSTVDPMQCIAQRIEELTRGESVDYQSLPMLDHAFRMFNVWKRVTGNEDARKRACFLMLEIIEEAQWAAGAKEAQVRAATQAAARTDTGEFDRTGVLSTKELVKADETFRMCRKEKGIPPELVGVSFKGDKAKLRGARCADPVPDMRRVGVASAGRGQGELMVPIRRYTYPN